MKKNIFFMLVILITILSQIINFAKLDDMEKTIYSIVVKDIDGKEIKLAEYKGKVLMIVNVASKCGFTPQYEGLQKLYEKFKEKGFEILAFPCNDFGGQEPGSNEEIKNFCTTNYNVTFKLFDKIKILGKEKSPLYKLLINSDNIEKGEVKWNFEKLLIDKKGNVIAKYRSNIKPESEEIINAIEELLKK